MAWLQRMFGKDQAAPTQLPAGARLAPLLGVTPPPVTRLDARSEAMIGPLSDLVLRHFATHQPEASSFPVLAAKVIDLVEQPDVDMGRLSKLVEQDGAIASKVLRAANSVLYARTGATSNVHTAVMRLGLRTVAGIAVGEASRSLFDLETRAHFEAFAPAWNKLFHHSMTVAFGASWFAMDRQIPTDGAFLGGMFHDVGKSMTLRSLADLLVHGRIGRPEPAVVDAVLERLHLRLGVSALVAWGLPGTLVDLCARHHEQKLPPQAPPSLHLVRVVSGINAIRVDASQVRLREGEVMGSAQALGISGPSLRSVADKVGDLAVWTTEVLEIPDFDS